MTRPHVAEHVRRVLRVLLCSAILATSVAHAHAADFANGADLGWVTQEEAQGQVFRDARGTQADPFVLLGEFGIDAIRLRVFVDPQDGWCGISDVLAKAKRAMAAHQRIMVDFHYSDGWADPGKQSPPAAWRTHDAAQLVKDVERHTHDTLKALKDAGIAVSWVQVGNEINGGMLWPEGATAHVAHVVHFDRLAQLLNSGYRAVKSVYPDSLVVLHLANGYDDGAFRWFFDHIKEQGAAWDAIGMSHYPPAADWRAYNAKIEATMRDMVTRYGTPVVISEVGMDWREPQATHDMLRDLIAKTRALGADGLGVFYWEPEAAPSWQGYTMGALDHEGRFTDAMRAFGP